MRNLVLAGLALSAAAGCSTSEEGGLITANWAFKNTDGSTIPTCPPGSDTATVHLTNVDTGEQFVDLYNCSDFTGTEVYPLGVYNVFVEINGYGSSLSAVVDIVDSDATASFALVDDGGYFLLDWNLVDAATNAPLTCAAAGEPDSIEITSTLSTGTTAESDKFECSDGSGVTGALLEGTYTISVAALNSSNQALGAPANSSGHVIQGQNRVTDLGSITIPID